MIEFRFRERPFRELREHLIRTSHADEEGALLLASESNSADRRVLLVTDIFPIPDSSLPQKGPGGLTIDPEFLAPIVKLARAGNASVILTHSHPFSDTAVNFSSIDDAGERSLIPKIRARAPDSAHGAIVFGRRSLAARVWLPGANASVVVDRVSVVGSGVRFEGGSNQKAGANDDRFARQVLAFSQGGQKLLGSIRVGIVGLGGIGSQVFQNLVHLGVHDFVLVDDDVVDVSNLSRLVGAVPEDSRAKRPKVEVMKRMGVAMDPSISVEAICRNVYFDRAAERLKSVDVIFGCTDTMVSRMVLTRFPKQYFIPFIDVGVNIQVQSGEISRIGGRVMALTPDDPCLDCMEYLNHDALTHELSKLGLVGPTPYITGLDDAVPAVISYNATLAGLAVSEFIRMIVPGFAPSEERTFQVLDGIDGVVRRVALRSARRCGVCDELLGKGDSVPLPTIRKT